MTKMLPLSFIYTKIFLEGPRDPLQISNAKLEASSVKLASSDPNGMLTYIHTQAHKATFQPVSQSIEVHSLPPGYTVKLKFLNS